MRTLHPSYIAVSVVLAFGVATASAQNRAASAPRATVANATGTNGSTASISNGGPTTTNTTPGASLATTQRTGTGDLAVRANAPVATAPTNATFTDVVAASVIGT